MEDLSRRNFFKKALLGTVGVAVASVIPKSIIEATEPEEKERDPIVWQTKDGRSLRLSEIEDKHLLNIIPFLHKGLDSINELLDAPDSFLTPFRQRRKKSCISSIENMTTEAQRRGLL